MDDILSNQYGLTFNPFCSDIPIEAMTLGAQLDSFLFRVQQQLRDGGFIAVTGEPGVGKSAALRIVAERLSKLGDVEVGILTRPQSNNADFYRELGHLFSVPLVPHYRWAGFKTLRETWTAQIEASRNRPVLLIDEAQEVPAPVLAELRILASTDFDSRSLLTVVLAGDGRLTRHFRHEDLLPIASRIRVRLHLPHLLPDQLLAALDHLLEQAGRPDLLTPEVRRTLAEHAAGNLRILLNMANDLLDAAARRRLEHIDAKLYFDLFNPKPAPRATT